MLRRPGENTSFLNVYRVTVGRLVRHFGPMPLASIRPRDVAGYVRRQSDRCYGAATINRDLSVLHDIFACAVREELADSNPAARAERPRMPKPNWRILEPAEVAAVERAFAEMIERSSGLDRRWIEQVRVVFLTVISTGIRYCEMLALRWRDVDLVDGVLRVRASKSEEGVRSIALGPALVEELCRHLSRSRFQGDDERVFCHLETGGPYRRERYRPAYETALRAAGIDEYVRPFHDLRHSSLTNGAAAGEGEVALMARAGHSSMATTKRYLHLAGVVFREEAERLERRLLGGLSTELSTDLSSPSGTVADGGWLNRAESGTSSP